MNRREFLGSTGVILGAASLSSRQHAQENSGALANDGNGRRIVVAGSGAMGGWTALFLAESGATVTLVDAYGPASSRAASAGETRLTRADYDDPLYGRMAVESYYEFERRNALWGDNLLVPTGQLLLAREDGIGSINRYAEVLAASGVEGVEILSTPEMEARWPQFGYNEIVAGLYTPGGNGATTIYARRATLAVAREFERAGGEIVQSRALPPAPSGDSIRVPLEDGGFLEADQVVYACGAWMSKLFPEIIAPKVRVERRDVFFIGSPAGNTSYSFPSFPAWAYLGFGYYGFPDLDGRGVKVAAPADRNSLDPDTDDRQANPYVARRAERFAREYLPGLAGQPIVETRVCQVDYTDDRDFIIDRHPEFNNVWLVAGGSGHAFKHGPSIGAHTADLLLDRPADQEMLSHFGLS